MSSGGKRDGAGRKRRRVTLRDRYVMERQPIAGLPQKPEMWRLLSVSDNEIEFQVAGDSGDIIVLRLPDG